MAKKVNRIEEEVFATATADGSILVGELDVDDGVEMAPVVTESNSKEEIDEYIETRSNKATPRKISGYEPISCLKNEVITVRFLPQQSGLVNNPKHVFYGNMAEGSVRTYTVPILESSGTYVNVLTNDEKNFLEEYMGLENNALSVHLRKNNFWENFQVRLIKGDTLLNLSDPMDYIKYKVLLANKDLIAKSLSEMQDHPKATYQYVIVAPEEEAKQTAKALNATMQAYMEFGKIQEEKDTLRVIIETVDGRPVAANSKLDFLQGQVLKTIQSNPKLFLQTVGDKLLPTKVLIKRCVEAGLISKRGTHYHLTEDNSPLCDNNEEPTFSIAAMFLNRPKHQDIKFSLEAKLKALQ